MTELVWPLPCIICGHQPEAVFVDEERQPWGATIFTSHGHYGSTVFDEMGRQFLEINICDSCLRQKAKENVIALGARIPRPDDCKYEAWHLQEGGGE